MKNFLWLHISVVIITLELKLSASYLYPYESESRDIRSLQGLWDFKISPEKDMYLGFTDKWYKKEFSQIGDSIKMPVPASFNDVTTNSTIRDFVGWVWYQRSFYAPKHWLQENNNVFIHFGSVHYIAYVFINGIKVGEHEGGHIPFQFQLPVPPLSLYNVLTVAVNNTLTPNTIPQGQLTYPNDSFRYPPGYKFYSHDFDYFDYAGINRPVIIFTTPKIYISGIEVSTTIEKEIGLVKYSVALSGDQEAQCHVQLCEKSHSIVAHGELCQGVLYIHNVHLWWPVKFQAMTPGYLYILKVTVVGQGSDPDTYRMPVGVRTISWTNNSLLINNKPVYLHGFGMHEDADIRGRGFDESIMTRDLHLISWIGANAVRTSHYPYAEEMLNQADEQGILVILEAPACSLKGFEERLLIRHKTYLTEMMEIHRNHPSIIMWSLANEPVSNSLQAKYYFGNLTIIARKIDKSRPITFVTSQQVLSDTAVEHVDVVCVNRYPGWYSDSGHLEVVSYQVKSEVLAWHRRYSKPIVITEYGAGSISGLHTLPASMWSEDYQTTIYFEHFKAFDELRIGGHLAGEMIWNFIDFNTPQEYIRPGRCSKGLFTRERQPKQAAHTVRLRYQNISDN